MESSARSGVPFSSSTLRWRGWKHRILCHVEQDGLAPTQNKETLTAPWSAAQLWERWRLKHEDAWQPSRRQAAFHGLELTTPQMFSACKLHTQSACRTLPTSSKVVLENSPEPTTRGTRCKKNGGLAGLWYMGDGDILCHPVLVPSYLHVFDASAKVGVKRNPQKMEVTHYVDDTWVPPGWRNDDVQNMAMFSTVTAGSTTLGVAVDPRQFIADQLLAKADVIRAMHERVLVCQHLLSSAKVSESAASTTSSECTATRSCRTSR